MNDMREKNRISSVRPMAVWTPRREILSRDEEMLCLLAVEYGLLDGGAGLTGGAEIFFRRFWFHMEITRLRETTIGGPEPHYFQLGEHES
ncbi:MAG: hypothetical protein GMKNLPBB_02341 [Myxococcota bacterium]|nr:hypothetical protein [Myxococcota bacterium]